ncbi:4670_t:CDS:2, partial [Racocetra persica]
MSEIFIDFDRFGDPEKIAEGGFGMICRYKYGDIKCVLKCSKKSNNCEVFDNEATTAFVIHSASGKSFIEQQSLQQRSLLRSTAGKIFNT